MGTLDPQIKKDLKKEDLSYTSDSNPGYFRQKYGKHFNYYDAEGKKITDKNTLSRINDLVIPPAWKDVWISPRANGHLQATGLDDRGRKQYIYHPDWIKISKQNKFSKMIDFGLNLPKIRKKIKYDLRADILDKKKVLATIVWLLERTLIRVGNEEYTKENNSYGLTTLRSRHVKVRGDEIVFKFRGKSGVENIIEISNPTVASTIKQSIELPGYELFKFVDDEGNRHVIDSEDVNLFLKDVTKDDFTAKDFRTWGATNLSARSFYKLGEPEDKDQAHKNIIETIKEVATQLNNTVAVCRSYYIHPTVIKTYTKKALFPVFDEYAKTRKNRRGLEWNEYALIKLLEKYPYVTT
jgi:DNA topoisomerase-1